MPEIQITADQRERLQGLQEDLASEVVGKYGHVRPMDAVEYLLDRYDEDETTTASLPVGDDRPTAEPAKNAATEETSDDSTSETDGDGTSGGAMLDAMMSLLDTHDDKWEESSNPEYRYAVTLPDGTTDHVRTKDDVRAQLFKHYR